MFTLFSALHTKQVWVAISALAVLLIFAATRFGQSEMLSVDQGDELQNIESMVAPPDYESALRSLTSSGFYVPPERPLSVNSASDNALSGSSRANEAETAPILRAIYTRNGKRAAYVSVIGGTTDVLEEEDLFQEWVVSDIDPTSIYLTKDEEWQRVYLFERLPQDEERE